MKIYAKLPMVFITLDRLSARS